MSWFFESVRLNTCVHRLDFGLYSHPKELLGYGVRTHVNSKGKKSPLPEARWRVETATLHHAGQRVQRTPTELFRPQDSSESCCVLVAGHPINMQGVCISGPDLAWQFSLESWRSRDRIPLAPGFFFRGRVIPVTSKLALQWLPCQAPGVIGPALGLVGPVSVYCDWVR